jgi:galactose mutarotase-like enzyme
MTRRAPVFWCVVGASIRLGLAERGHCLSQDEGIALEPQHFPDSPNQLDFPSMTLLPDETYETTTIFKFDDD